MIWNNTKLLLRLYFRPVSAMSGLIDEGHWIYAIIVVALLSVVFEFAVTTPIYSSYEAVYRELPAENGEEVTPEPTAVPAPAPV